MKAFGKDEMEVLNANADPKDVGQFLLDLVCYVLEEDVTLWDGETIGFTVEQKLPITRGRSEVLEGETLKIGYPQE